MILMDQVQLFSQILNVDKACICIDHAKSLSVALFTLSGFTKMGENAKEIEKLKEVDIRTSDGYRIRYINDISQIIFLHTCMNGKIMQ